MQERSKACNSLGDAKDETIRLLEQRRVNSESMGQESDETMGRQA